jgi:hypothetical protein
MGQTYAPLREANNRAETSSIEPSNNGVDIKTLVDENTQLRELVIQLSKIVVKNVLEKN